MPTQQTQTQTYEQFAAMWDKLAGWSANFSSGVVDAFQDGGTSAAERLSAVRAQYQTAIAAAIVQLDYTPLAQHGNDSLYGGRGNDTLFGDGGDDYLDGQYHGADYLEGGPALTSGIGHRGHVLPFTCGLGQKTRPDPKFCRRNQKTLSGSVTCAQFARRHTCI